MTETTTTLEQNEQKAQFIWTGFILMFFAIQFVIWTIAILFTANDPSHAVVADYDEKALHWDEEVALRKASARLGWHAELLVDPAADIRKIHQVTLEISNENHEPVSDASLQITAFHRALAGDPQQIQFSEIGDGVYSGKIAIHKGGLWQFEGRASNRAGNVCLISQQHLVKVDQ